jgi:hypothetical protein
MTADTIREEGKYFLAKPIIILQDASKNPAAPYVIAMMPLTNEEQSVPNIESVRGISN